MNGAYASYWGSPHTVVMNAQLESQPFLNGRLKNSNSEKARTHYFSSYVFDIVSWTSFALAILSLVFAIVWVSMPLATDKFIRSVYETTTFLSSYDKTNIDSWIVQTKPWSDVANSNAYVETQFTHYYECWYTAQMAWDVCHNSTINDYKTCIKARYSTQLDTCANASSPNYISPSLNEYATCVNNFLLPSRHSLNTFKICLRTNSWPLYESPEPVDSLYFLGSYNWMSLVTVGFLGFACFMLYTSAITTDEKRLWKSPYTYTNDYTFFMIITFVCLAIVFSFLVVFLVMAFKPSADTFGSSYPYPNSIATNTVIIPTLALLCAYFIMELSEKTKPTKTLKKYWNKVFANENMDSPQRTLENQGQIVYASEYNTVPNATIAGGAKYIPQKFAVHPLNPNANTVTEDYFPALLITWSDAYLIDAVLFLGFIGATQQVSTALAYQIFVVVLTYRFLYTIISRLLFEGYIFDDDQGTAKFTQNSSRTAKVNFSVRMQAMFLQVAATLCVIILGVILFNEKTMISEFGMILALYILWYLVPEVIRLGSHLIVAAIAWEDTDDLILFTANSFVWIWDVVVRLIFIMIIVWGYKDIAGTSYFLEERLNSISSTIALMTY